MKNAIRLLLVVLCLYLIGCSGGPGDPRSVRPGIEVHIVDYGNGVYYFNSSGANFANDLSTFLRINQDLEVSSTEGDGGCSSGSNCGFFVTFRKKK